MNIIDMLSSFLVDVASTVLITLLCWAVRQGINWLTTKIENERLKTALQELESVVIDGIYYMEQTVVKYNKEYEHWDTQTQKEVLDNCKQYVLNTLSEKCKQALTEENKARLESLIVSKIEAELGRLHKS